MKTMMMNWTKTNRTVHDGEGKFRQINTPIWRSVEGSGKICWAAKNTYDEDNDELLVSPILHKLVPESKELLQCLHHAYTYESPRCFLVIGDKRSYLGSILMTIPGKLLDAYEEILNYLYEKVYKWAYVPSEEDDETLPLVPESVYKAFDSKKLKHVKMTKEAFLCHFGLWRSVTSAIFNERHSTILLPIPKTARIVPFNVAAWNSLKGGSDTITKLIEICREKIGVRTENNVACARLLLYYAVTFHRCYQILSSAEDLNVYGTLYHWRNAASHRSTMGDSLELFFETLLKFANNAGDAKNRGRKTSFETIPHPLFEPSPGLSVSTRSQTPQIQRMPFGRSSTGSTPGKGKSIDSLEIDFAKRCKECTGIYLAKRVPEPENIRGDISGDDESLNEEDSDDDMSAAAAAAIRKNKNVRVRTPCFICKAKTEYFCHGCGRSLCFKFKAPEQRNLEKVLLARKKERKSGESSKKQSKSKRRSSKPKTTQLRIKRRYPKVFCVEVPKTTNGVVELDPITRMPIIERMFGEYTCFHIAHHEAWKLYLRQS